MAGKRKNEKTSASLERVIAPGASDIDAIKFGRRKNEKATNWLERVIPLGASDSVIAGITALLNREIPLATTQATVVVPILNVKPRRFERWQLLNSILDPIAKQIREGRGRKAKKPRLNYDDEVKSLAFSSIPWEKVKNALHPTQYEQASSPVDDLTLEFILKYLGVLNNISGDIEDGNETKRLHFIFAVLSIVCSTVEGVEIEFEKTVEGKNIHVTGRFEFVLKKGEIYVGILEAKNSDLAKGKAQALIGCEALVDNNNLPTVCAIVTTYDKWLFCLSSDDVVSIDTSHLDFVGGSSLPTHASLKIIAEKICGILTHVGPY